MAIKKYKPTSPGRRGMTTIDKSHLAKERPYKKLLSKRPSHAGRNNYGRITSRFRGGGHKRLYRTIDFRRDNYGVAGVVASRWSNGWGVNKVFFARNEIAPAIDVSCEDYGLLYRLAEQGQGPVLRVRSDAEILPDVPTFNTVAEIRGSEKPDEYVMLSAHFDSWDGGSGATDNGTGTVMMMEVMRILKRVDPSPRRTILVGHWSGEEQGLNGSSAFA